MNIPQERRQDLERRLQVKALEYVLRLIEADEAMPRDTLLFKVNKELSKQKGR